ncbi:SDR family NAD(P)-dependent oxidoreductase [Rhodobacteraceae bacterium]|nr:SDR family NAD(P)-dependent oxidoreductase [Paracoccaceae bacterium]
MRDWTGKRYWIIGASAGLGRAVAREISKTGAEVILSARDEPALRDLAASLPGRATVIPMDVSDTESVAHAAKLADEPDGLVYLAGVYWPMPATEFDGDKAAAMIDINLTGAARVLGHVLPQMVERDSGHIVFTGSLSGFRGLPRASGYGASKAGMMSMAETLYADLRGTGVDVQLVNPGFVKSRLTDKNDFSMPFIMETDVAARLFVDHMQDRDFARNFPRGFAALFRLSQFLPDWLYYRLFR